MPSRPVAQALVQAHRERFTGFVRIVAGSRVSRLAYREGDLVDAEIGFGHQTAAQALLQEWRLTPDTLDALWARGATDLDDAALGATGLSADDARLARTLATVRRIVEAGEGVELEQAEIEARWQVSGERAARAAQEILGEPFEAPAEAAPEAAPAQDESQATPPTSESERAPLDWASMVDPDAAALAAAREAAQQEIDEAMRRAGAAQVDAWLAGEPDSLESLTVPAAALATDAEDATTPIFDAAELSLPPSDDLDDSLWALLQNDDAAVDRPSDDTATVSSQTAGELAEEWLIEEDLSGDPSDPAEASRLRRQRLLRRAMENMGTLPRQNAPVNAQTVAPAEPLPELELTPAHTIDDRNLARLIEERHALLVGKRDYFKVLGLTQQAGRDEIKRAFISQAKTFHPDRLPASLAPLTPKMSAIFEAIREAYETLYDDARRAQYLQRLAMQAVGAERGKESGAEARAAEEFRRGEAAFRKRDWASAEAAHARAYALDPKPDYLAARAWAIYMDPARKGDAARVRQMLHEALKANPQCDRAHYQLGVIARVENDIAAAERHFRQAVEENPRHLEAAQELRLIEMRKKKGKKGGFFG